MGQVLVQFLGRLEQDKVPVVSEAYDRQNDDQNQREADVRTLCVPSDEQDHGRDAKCKEPESGDPLEAEERQVESQLFAIDVGLPRNFHIFNDKVDADHPGVDEDVANGVEELAQVHPP